MGPMCSLKTALMTTTRLVGLSSASTSKWKMSSFSLAYELEELQIMYSEQKKLYRH